MIPSDKAVKHVRHMTHWTLVAARHTVRNEPSRLKKITATSTNIDAFQITDGARAWKDRREGPAQVAPSNLKLQSMVPSHPKCSTRYLAPITYCTGTRCGRRIEPVVHSTSATQLGARSLRTLRLSHKPQLLRTLSSTEGSCSSPQPLR